MIDVAEVNKEINRLENGATNYSSCEKLSQLYVVRDHIQKDRSYAPDYSFAAYPTSEFLKATDGIPMEHILNVMDEHMEVIKAMYPREYKAIIKKIKNV